MRSDDQNPVGAQASERFSGLSFVEQLEIDAAMADEPPPTLEQVRETLELMELSAPWEDGVGG